MPVRIAYFDCFSGFAGDMALGALVDAGADPAAVAAAIAPLGLGTRFELRFERVRRGALSATKARVEVTERDAPARTLYDVEALIERAAIDRAIAAPAREAFRRLAEAEARVHGTSVESVHFHEVGAIDAIVDICGTCAALALLGIEEVRASEPVLGRGTIRSAHGELPAPGPAVLALLEGVPVRSRDVPHELTTPTGAALLRALARGFGPMPAMTLRAVGVGAGEADFPTHANVCRVLVGERAAPGEPAAAPGPAGAAAPAPERCVVIETNLDDLSPQLVAHAVEACFRAGALDAFTIPCHMKKGRPGVLFAAIAPEGAAAAVEEAIFRETTTFGVRRRLCDRTVLAREIARIETAFGPVEVKLGRLGGRVLTATPEFESVRRLAEERGAPLRAVHEAATEAAARLRRSINS